MHEQQNSSEGPEGTESALTRRQVMAMAGLGTAAGMLRPLVGGSAASAAEPRSAAAADVPTPRMLSADRYPIGLWWPPHPYETTLERYQEMADAGFTFIHANNYVWADSVVQGYALGLADQVGLQVLVDEPRVRWLTHDFNISDAGGDFTLTTREATTTLGNVLNTYRLRSFWQLQDGRLLMTGGTSTGSIGYSAAGADWTDYRFAFDIAPRQTGGGGSYAQAGFAFRVQDEQNAYVWMLSNYPYTSPAQPGYLVKGLFVGGAPRWLTPVPLDFAVTAANTYHVEIEVSGTTITSSINGQVVDTMTDSTYPKGRVGFREAGPESAFFDNVRVTDRTGKVLLTDDFSTDLSRWTDPGLGHRSFAGINLYDEPSAGKFATLATAVQIMRTLNPDALPYVNLLPSSDINYYRSFVQTVAPAVLSFDSYPLLLDGDDQGWFNNLAIVRTVALEAGIPYWTFIQSIKYANHRMPTPAELSWEIGIALAYGYKGIQYFTYWTPDPARGEAFEPALVTVDGKLTPLWYAAKSINPVLQYVGKRILPLTSQSVAVTGVATPPAGLPAFTADDWIADATGDAVVIGQFAGSGDAAERTLVVTNWSHDKAAKATLTPAPAVDRVVIEEQPGGRPPSTVTGPVRLSLAAGSFALITLTRA